MTAKHPLDVVQEALEVLGLSYEIAVQSGQIKDDDGSITSLANEALTALRQHREKSLEALRMFDRCKVIHQPVGHDTLVYHFSHKSEAAIRAALINAKEG